MISMVSLLPPIKSLDWCKQPAYRIARSKPFVESFAGRYTHRVRSAVLHTWPDGRWPSHISVRLWCGNSINVGGGGTSRRNRFVDEPSDGRPVCATCEGRAIGAGMAGAREIAGRAVMFAPNEVRG